MIRGTTPTFTLTLSDNTIDLGDAENVYVTLRQGKTDITKSGTDLTIDDNVVSVFLTQEESLDLSESTTAEVQVNWTYLDTDGTTVRRAATKVKEIPITKQLLKRVIE